MILAAPLAILWIGGVLLALADGRRRWVGLAGLAILGACIMAVVFAGHTAVIHILLVELFPTRVRATGQGVSYNAGRIFAAVGALYAGVLVAAFSKQGEAAVVNLASGYAKMGVVITMIYLLGMITIWFAPETKNKPLPT